MQVDSTGHDPDPPLSPPRIPFQLQQAQNDTQAGPSTSRIATALEDVVMHEQGGSRHVARGRDDGEEDFEWTMDLELAFLRCLPFVRPVGLNRNFLIISLQSQINSLLGDSTPTPNSSARRTTDDDNGNDDDKDKDKDVGEDEDAGGGGNERYSGNGNGNYIPPKALWRKLGEMYDLDELDDMADDPFPTHSLHLSPLASPSPTQFHSHPHSHARSLSPLPPSHPLIKRLDRARGRNGRGTSSSSRGSSSAFEGGDEEEEAGFRGGEVEGNGNGKGKVKGKAKAKEGARSSSMSSLGSASASGRRGKKDVPGMVTPMEIDQPFSLSARPQAQDDSDLSSLSGSDSEGIKSGTKKGKGKTKAKAKDDRGMKRKRSLDTPHRGRPTDRGQARAISSSSLSLSPVKRSAPSATSTHLNKPTVSGRLRKTPTPVPNNDLAMQQVLGKWPYPNLAPYPVSPMCFEGVGGGVGGGQYGNGNGHGHGHGQSGSRHGTPSMAIERSRNVRSSLTPSSNLPNPSNNHHNHNHSRSNGAGPSINNNSDSRGRKKEKKRLSGGGGGADDEGPKTANDIYAKNVLNPPAYLSLPSGSVSADILNSRHFEREFGLPLFMDGRVLQRWVDRGGGGDADADADGEDEWVEEEREELGKWREEVYGRARRGRRGGEGEGEGKVLGRKEKEGGGVSEGDGLAGREVKMEEDGDVATGRNGNATASGSGSANGHATGTGNLDSTSGTSLDSINQPQESLPISSAPEPHESPIPPEPAQIPEEMEIDLPIQPHPNAGPVVDAHLEDAAQVDASLAEDEMDVDDDEAAPGLAPPILESAAQQQAEMSDQVAEEQPYEEDDGMEVDDPVDEIPEPQVGPQGRASSSIPPPVEPFASRQLAAKSNSNGHASDNEQPVARQSPSPPAWSDGPVSEKEGEEETGGGDLGSPPDEHSPLPAENGPADVGDEEEHGHGEHPNGDDEAEDESGDDEMAAVPEKAEDEAEEKGDDEQYLGNGEEQGSLQAGGEKDEQEVQESEEDEEAGALEAREPRPSADGEQLPKTQQTGSHISPPSRRRNQGSDDEMQEEDSGDEQDVSRDDLLIQAQDISMMEQEDRDLARPLKASTESRQAARGNRRSGSRGRASSVASSQISAEPRSSSGARASRGGRPPNNRNNGVSTGQQRQPPSPAPDRQPPRRNVYKLSQLNPDKRQAFFRAGPIIHGDYDANYDDILLPDDDEEDELALKPVPRRPKHQPSTPAPADTTINDARTTKHDGDPPKRRVTRSHK